MSVYKISPGVEQGFVMLANGLASTMVPNKPEITEKMVREINEKVKNNPHITNDANYKAMLFITVRNKCLDYLTKLKVQENGKEKEN